MEQTKSRLGTIVDYATEYVEKKGEILFLDVVEKSSTVVSTLASGVVLSLLGIFIILFASIGFAWWIATATGSVAIGFFAITGFYLALFIFTLVAGKRMIENSIINLIIKKIFYDK